MKFHMLFGSDNTPIFGELTIAHNEAFFASEDGAVIRKMKKPEIENMTPDGMSIKGFVAVGIKKGIDQFEIHEWRCNLSCSGKATTLTAEKIEAAILITADEAKKSYADFIKIDENILMLLNEDDNAFYFLHRKKDFWWKTSVSKKVKELFSPLYSITEKEIESYNKWLNGSK